MFIPLSLSQVGHSRLSVLPLPLDKKYSARIVTSRWHGFVGFRSKKSINILLLSCFVSIQDSVGRRPDLPDYLDVLDDEYEPILSLFYACTMEKPEQRPSAKLIVENIEKIATSLKTAETEKVAA